MTDSREKLPGAERSQEKNAPRRDALHGEDSSQEKNAPRRRTLPGEEHSGEAKASRREALRGASFKVFGEPDWDPISDLHAAQRSNRPQSC
jgi:hypothetical protein